MMVKNTIKSNNKFYRNRLGLIIEHHLKVWIKYMHVPAVPINLPVKGIV